MIGLDEVCKIYRTGTGEVKALDRVSLEIRQGEFVVIRGPSGSGKTTLLLTMGAMLKPTRGTVKVKDHDLYRMGAGPRARFRARQIGFVFQMYYLVPYLNILENVLLAGASGLDKGQETRARDLLQQLRLSERWSHKPSELSAGERQRTALARALLHEPALILADEPTGNLDLDNAREALDHLAAYHDKGGTVVVVTHGTAGDDLADRIIRLEEGGIRETVEEKQK